MAELTNREIVERFVEAMNVGDLDRASQYLANDFLEVYPQSGERIHGPANRRAVIENYPGRADRDFVPGKPGALIGGDQWVLTPTMSLVRLNGSGERFTATGRITYPNGESWFLVQLFEVRNGKIAKITTYFAPPFEPAPYRAKVVELGPVGD
jgi:limonene-1,2-epoxide hydrolase